MLLKIYYIRAQITGDPCNLIGSHWHDLLIKCTAKVQQQIRFNRLF